MFRRYRSGRHRERPDHGPGNGGVDVRVVKRSVRGQAGRDDLIVDIDLDDGALTVDTALDRRASVSTQQTPTADVTITVSETQGPKIAAVTSEIGDVTLLGTRGDTVVRTDIGDVVASGVDGHLSLSSRVGAILVSDVAGLNAASSDIGSTKSTSSAFEVISTSAPTSAT